MTKSKKLVPVKQSEQKVVHCKLPAVEIKKSNNTLDASWIAEIASYSKHKYQGD